MDSTEFFAVYEEVRAAVNAKKLKRKREMKMEALTNPEAYARKKMKHNLNKVKARKRKNQEFSKNRTPIKVRKMHDGEDVKTTKYRIGED